MHAQASVVGLSRELGGEGCGHHVGVGVDHVCSCVVFAFFGFCYECDLVVGLERWLGSCPDGDNVPIECEDLGEALCAACA